MKASTSRQRSGIRFQTVGVASRSRRSASTALGVVLAVALVAGPLAARATPYVHTTGTPGASPATAITTCGNATAASTVAIAPTAAGTCTSQTIAVSVGTTSAPVAYFVSTARYSTTASTRVTGKATGNAIVVATAGTTGNTRHTFTAALGYVAGTTFTALSGTAPTLKPGSTAATLWNPDFSSYSGDVPANAFLAVRVTAAIAAGTASNATVYFGTNAGGAGASGSFDVTEVSNATAAGTPSVSQVTGATPSVNVSAPYTGDGNSNLTIAIAYKLTSDATWTTAATSAAHPASPYATTISGLTCGASYDFRVTYTDAEGVTGTTPWTTTLVPNNCTGTGALTGDGSTCGQATASAAFTGDANASGSTTFDRGPSAAGPWTAACGGVGGATPRRCTDAPAAGTYWYRATFSDADGVSGTNPVVSGASVSVTPCPIPSTTVGAVSATPAGTSLAPTLAISAAYTDDADGDNTLSYRTRTPSGSGTWSGATAVAHAASPYAVSAPASCGSSYDVEVTFVDADGVTGTNPTTISSVQTVACPTIAIGDSSAGEAATTLVPGAASVVLDAFTLQTSAGVVAPSSITVAMPSGSAPLVAQLTLEDSQACDHLTAHATISSPATDTPTFTGISGIPVSSSSPTAIWVCLTPKTHAAMPPPPGSQVAVTGRVTGVVAVGYTTTGSDATGAARTIDNLSPDAPGAFTGTVSGAQVSFTWTNPADAAQLVVLRWNGSAPGSEVPLEGKAPDYAVGNAVGTATVACVVNAPATGCTDASVVSGSTYAYEIFARDAKLNWSVAAPSSPASFTPIAATPTTMLVSSSDPAGARICPGATAYVDRFGFAVSGATDTISTLTFQGLGGSAPLASVEIRDDSGAALAPPRTGTPFGDTYLFGSANLPAPVGTASYRLYVTARPHASLPDGELPIQPTVQSFGSTNAPSGSDAANGFFVDHAPPAQATWGTVTPGAGTVQLAWTNPTDPALQQVFVLRREATGPFTETFAGGSAVPAQGTTTAGGSYVVWSGSATSGAPVSVNDTTVVNDTGYVYRVYAVDACGNFNAGASAGPYYPAGPFVAEGSTTPGAPMVSIVNPQKGNVVKGAFRVQIRVYNPVAQGGIAGLVGAGPWYSLDDGATWTTDGVAASSSYDSRTGGIVTGRTYEVTLSRAPGRYTLRAKVSNAVASDVRSNGVPVTSVANGGDGRLLVRDNSSQLCSDCHAGHAHTSESTGDDKGSWATTCRDCHAPHGTRNLGLIAERITPPGITGPTTPQTVTLYNRTGAAPDSYANGSGTGVCQVCHTQTRFYRADGTSPGGAHETATCTGCHQHGKGLSASCSMCHGTEGRASVDGADPKQAAAPPRVASGAAVFVQDGGAHLAHVNQTTWRSAPLACSSCHTMPNTHQPSSQTDVAWSALASAGGVTVQPPAGAIAPAWTATPTCTNWCHGAGLAGGGGTNVATPPAWSGTAAPCGSCHASPPPVDGTVAADHPQNPACASCHGGDYAQASIGPTSKATHVDGTLQKPENGCTACHGTLAGLAGAPVANTSATAAPGYDPGVGAVGVDTRGNVDRALASVGAHDRHVDPAMMSPKDCATCHGATPADGDTTHANGVVAAGFTAPASAGGVAPAPAAFTAGWQSSPTCTNYCHSTGKPIGLTATTAAPVWTSTSRMACTSCHGDAATLATNAHPKHLASYGIACQACHARTTDDGASIVLGGGLHVDGSNDVRFTTTDPLWSPLVMAGAYDSGQYTCASTYCHSNGTASAAPFPPPVSAALAWTGTSTCTSCHGGPSGSNVVMGVGAGNGSAKHASHVENAALIGTNYACGDCHQATVAAGTDAPLSNRANHVDGRKTVAIAPRGGFASADTTAMCGATYCHSSGQATPAYVTPAPAWTDATWTTVCNQCHGRTNSAGAPEYPSGAAGSPTANTHLKHTANGADSTTCQNCHAGTAAAAGNAIATGSALHTDGAREVSILAAYDTNGGSQNYDAATKTCSSVACHGTRTAQWGGTLACTGCHGQVGRGGIPGADPNQAAAPPDGLAGETSSGTRAVGAHLAHVNQATLRTTPQPCSECHRNATHDGTKQVAWGTLATTGGRSPQWNGATCASTYCHAPGGAEAGGSNRAPTWTAGVSQAACGTCHGAPPPLGGGIAGADHPQNTSCGACHGAGYGAGTATAASHVNGSTTAGVDKPANGCTACHGVLAGVAGAAVAGTSMTAAPGYVGATTGVDTRGDASPSNPRVGAHDAHVRPAGGLGAVAPLDCANCHGQKPPDGTTAHADGTIALGWSALATSAGVAAAPPAYTSSWESSPSCTNYCHSNAKPLGQASATTTAVTWTSTAAMTCTSCHSGAGTGGGTNLSSAHLRHTDAVANGGYALTCDRCHVLSATGNGAIVAGGGRHVNGARNVDFDGSGQNNSGGSYDYAQYRCSNTYCHSSGQDRNGADGYVSGPSVAWNGTTTCASCHGYGTTMVNQAHGAHTNQAGTYGTTFGCQTCHYPTTHDGTTIASTSSHVNGAADVDGNPAGTLKYGDAANAAPNSCTTYCHSAGSKNAGGTPPQYVSSMSWTTTTLTGCGSCHGAYSPGAWITKAGEPNYANGGVSSLLANSHNSHVGDATSCVNCHAQTVNASGTIANAANHLNGRADVVFSAAYSSITYTPRSGSSAPGCVNVSCHDNPAQPAQWGGTLAESPCSTCHMQSGAPNGDVDDFVFQNGIRAYIDTEDWARTGHGRATAFTDPGQSGNAGPNFVVDATVEGCFYCHSPKVALKTGGEAVSHGDQTNPFRLVNSTWAAGTKNGTCLVCHAAGSATGFDPDGAGATYGLKLASTNARVNAAHYGADHATGGKGGELCWDCHDPHGDYNYAQSRPIAFMIHERPVRTHELADPYGWGVPQLTPTSELTAQTVDFSAAVSGGAAVFDGTDYARTSAPYTGVCQVCHTTTSQQRADGTNAGHMTGAQCTTCHAHNQPTATDAFVQVTACDACHAAVPGASGKHTLHVGAATPAYGGVAPASTLGAYAFNCGKCHTTVATNHYSDNAGGTAARPYQVDVGFDWASGATPYALGTASTDSGPTGLVFRTTAGTCSTYCHSNASPVGGTNAWAAPTWTGAATTCTSCHQMQATATVPDANLSHAHRVHTAATASGGYFYDCAACHNGIAAGKSDYPTTAASIGDKSKHVNGARDVALNATQSPGWGYAQAPSYTCSSVYCHSNATPVGKTAAFQNRAWNGAGPLGCTDCHGAKDAATTMSASHAKHINSGYAFGCQRCHQPTTTDGVTITNRAKHSDGAKQDVAFDALNPSGAYAGGTSYTCSSLYCHSNATPTGGGTLLAATPKWTDAAYAAGSCTQCHSNVGRDTTSIATDLSPKHGKHVAATTYAYKCDECHAATMQNDSSTVVGTPSMHVNNGKDVKFSTTFLTTTIDQSLGQYVSGGCTATYCHSGGVRTASPFSATATSTALAWTTGSSTSCQGCHGFTAASRPTIGVATGSSFQGSPVHAAHVDNAPVVGTNFVCADCHQATVSSGNSPVTTFSAHVNGVKDVRIAPRGAVTSNEPYTGGSCSATYCHSSGEASPAYRSIAWNGGPTLGCNGCHGLPNTATGAPDYTSGNSHAKHTANGTDPATCQNCHATTVTPAGTAILTGSALHVNGTRDVAILSTYDTNGASPNYDASKTCSAVSCHGTGTAVWGGTATCTSCHGTTGVENTEVGANFWANNTIATINTNEWAYSGHGRTGTNYDVTGKPPAAFPTSPTSGTSECLYCHDDQVGHKDGNNPYRLRGATNVDGVSSTYSTASPNAICLDCHATIGANGVDPDGTAGAYTKKNGTTKADAAHDGAKHVLATLGGKFCWDCHDPHGDRTSSGGNIAMIRANVIAKSDGTHGYVGASGSSVAVNYTLWTGTTPALGKAVETSTPQGSQHVGLCQACHHATTETLPDPNAWTKWWNRLGYDDPDGVTGANPVPSAHNSGSSASPYCVSCHAHNSKFAGAGESAGGAACDSCHSDLYVSMTNGTHYHKLMAADAAYPTAAPTSATDGNRKCVMCHVDHDIFRSDMNASGGRGKNLRADIAVAPTAANTASYSNKDFDATLTNGGICVSCHRNTMPRNTDATAGTVTMAIPKTDFAASAHTYSGTGTTATFAAGGTAAMLGDCGKCHNDTSAKQYQTGYPQATHNSTLRSMQAPLGMTAPADPLAEKMCFRCHSLTTDTTPGGGPAKTSANRDYFNAAPMTSQSERIYQVVTNTTTYPFGHPIGDSPPGLHRTSDGEGAAQNNGSLSGANRHSTCADCHNPHAAKPVSAAQRGTVSAFAAGTAPTMDTLTDSSKAWTANQWVGYTVKILSGTGAGSTSAIYANTPTALSVEFGTTVPAVSSTYVILHTGRANGNTPGGAEANAWGVQPTFPTQPTPPNWNDVGAIANANDITNQYTAITTWQRTTTPAIQGQICIKCHSAYAYGSTPPYAPSGVGTTGTTGWSNSVTANSMLESDLANQFNPNNLSHHAVFARGKNQPLVSSDATVSTYNAAWPKFTTGTLTATNGSTAVTFTNAVPATTLPGWFVYIGSATPAQATAGWYEIAAVTDSTHLVLDRAYTGTTGASKAFMLTAGLANNFVPPWGPWSTLQCSDCHSSDSSTDPFGPHGSGTKWILTKAATQNFMFWNGTAVANVSLAPADPNNLCLNCHRTDVYGDLNVVAATNRTWARQTHPMDTSQGQAFKSKPKWGIVCMNCHGGARAGTIHGTNLGKGNNGAAGSYSGKRLLAGAYWSGVTRSTTGAAGSCFVKGATDSVSNCSNGSAGAFTGPANYTYDDTAP